MLFILLGIIGGIIIGWFAPITIPVEYTRYTAVVILSIFDAVIGAIRAQLTHNEYDAVIFTTGLLFNGALALGITLLGDLLGLDLYLAATVVLTFRIFKNMGVARRNMFHHLFKNGKHTTKSIHDDM